MKKKTKKAVGEISFTFPTTAIVIESEDDAAAALEEMEEISAAIEAAQRRTVELKKAATDWAVDSKVAVIQLGDHYYRQIQRSQRQWDLEKLKKITKDMTTPSGKSLFNFITRRSADPDKINQAVAKKFISEKKINKAFVEKPQAPFLQRFQGEAIDG